MRAAIAVGAGLGLVALTVLAAFGGHSLGEPSLNFDRDAGQHAAGTAAAALRPAIAKRSADEQFPMTAMVTDGSGYERIAPREPLSRLSLALPPEPKVSDEWEGTILHRPVATSAGLIETKDLTIALAGTETVLADERCSYEGKSWNCGLRARTAFRGLLRGRSPMCALPPQADGNPVKARCRLGKQDLGEWLVSNGWARASAGGPYVEAEAKAREKRLGIFGPPPDTTPVLALPDELPRSTPSIEYLGPRRNATSVLPQAPSE